MLATLDFLGWGVQPPLPTRGNMLGFMEALVLTGWWAAVFPAVCIFIAVLVIEWAARTVEESDEPRTP